MIVREIERYLEENPVTELVLPCSEWDTSIERDKNDNWQVVLRKKA